MELIDCKFFGTCSGCTYPQSGKNAEKTTKLNHLRELIKDFSYAGEIEFQDFSLGTRDRLDFVISDGKLGLWSHSQNAILDLDHCPQLHPDLQKYFTDFRKIRWPIEKGSFRLRRGWNGLRGAWLDFANVDIKNLLSAQTELRQLLEISDVVEIGQKYKVLQDESVTLKLKDAKPHPWWSTKMDDQIVPLYSSIGAFTQPSQEANIWILDKLTGWVRNSGKVEILELGAGIGNMTFTLAPYSKKYYALENDRGNLLALNENLNHYPLPHLEIIEADFHRTNTFPKVDLVLANPARSGLGAGVSELLNRQIPGTFLYMSCFPESWARDCKTMVSRGYKLKNLLVVNQFPLSKHYEILSRFVHE